SRSITTLDDDDCPSQPPSLIGPGDSEGEVKVSNPVHFRWTEVANAERYRVVYSLERGNGKDVVLGTVATNELIAEVPLGAIKWKVFALGDDDDCAVNSQSLKFTVVDGTCAAPAITTQPAGGMVDMLTVAASGTAPLTYQWFANGQATGTNSNTLSVNVTQPTTYRVEITNACGTTRSNDVVVTPSCTAPSITAQPAGGVVEMLTVTAGGTAPLTYQWFADGQPTGTNSNTLSVDVTQPTTYRVEITNACGTIRSNDVVVTPSCVAPAITVEPAGGTNVNLLTVDATGTAPLVYQWYAAGQPTGTNSPTLTVGNLEHTTSFRVEITNACGSVRSNTVLVHVEGSSCPGLTATPEVFAVATVTSGVEYRVEWNGVAHATSYEIEEAADASFTAPSSQRVNGLAAMFRHDVATPMSLWYRVRAVNGCDDSTTDYSRPIRVAVVPEANTNTTTTDLVVPHGTTDVQTTRVTVRVDPSATTFSATASEPWITVTPASGGVPADGELTFTLSFDPRSLPHGTSSASLHVVTSGTSSRVGTHGSTALTIPISISLVTPVLPAVAKNGGEVLVIPAVAHADGNNSRWQSDVRITHTYPAAVRYNLTFTPTGGDISSAQQTEIAVAANQTIALDDILGRWFGSGMAAAGATGVLEIRTLDAVLSQGRTLATSRLFNAATEGSFGQFVAAVPLQKFVSGTGRQSLVGLSQSHHFRTNVGVVAGGTHPAAARLEVFGANGAKLYETVLRLKPGEHQQLGSLLAALGTEATNARVDVTLTSPAGRVYGYASVIDNATGDPSFVPPVDVTTARARRYTIAGVANLGTATGSWQTDVRLFNGSNAHTTASVDFFRQGESAAAATRTIDVAPGEMLALDDVVQSLFGMSGAGGAMRITTSIDSALVPAARTYHKREDGTFGQFIPGATDDQAAALGREALRILQVEESSRFRTNVGLAEVTGNGATLEITATVPGTKVSATTQVELQPNEFRQLNGLLRSLGMDDAYNASVTVRVVGGAGKVLAYGSVIDNRTQDPTYVMAQ
ncbi:MAG TPA: hypothetical protein VEK11_08640, partial [Thermoanaerobaculia bacterium]|nr:hypothetical protein [Thermoanaerobaculia bacterium]